jgi:hypothetical protein
MLKLQNSIMIVLNLGSSDTGLTARRLLRKYILVFYFGTLCMGLFANAPLASKQQIGMFKSSKTCVVFENGIGLYNTFIKDAVQKYWKSTSYEFIDRNEFEKRRTDPKYSFIILMDGAFNKDPAGVKYNYINLILGDASGNLTKMPEFCSIPLSYKGDDAAGYEYVIPAIIKFFQIHLKNLENNRFPISMNGLKYYNKTGFKDKYLLMNKDKMASAVNTQEKVKNVYPYNIKLLSIAEINEEISTNPENTLFHYHVGPALDTGAGKCFEMIFDQDGNLYYYNFRKITNDNGDGFNLDDFNRIRKSN